MEYNFIDIGNKLTELRNKHDYSQEELIDILKTKYNVPIGRNTYSKIENGIQQPNHFSLGLLKALSEIYNCEIGYLLCEYDCPTGRNTDIKAETGLDNDSICSLKNIQNQDFNEREYSGSSLNRPALMQLLNLMISNNGIFECILRAFRDFIKPEYTVPVYFDENKKSFVFPDNDFSKMHRCGSHWLNLASSENNPNDNIPLLINSTFFENVALKDIEKQLYILRDLYNEKKA